MDTSSLLPSIALSSNGLSIFRVAILRKEELNVTERKNDSELDAHTPHDCHLSCDPVTVNPVIIDKLEA